MFQVRSRKNYYLDVAPDKQEKLASGLDLGGKANFGKKKKLNARSLSPHTQAFRTLRAAVTRLPRDSLLMYLWIYYDIKSDGWLAIASGGGSYQQFHTNFGWNLAHPSISLSPGTLFLPVSFVGCQAKPLCRFKASTRSCWLHYITSGRVCYSLLTPGHTCTYVSSSSANFASSSLSRYLPS